MPTSRERVSMLDVEIVVSRAGGGSAIERATSLELEISGDEWDSDGGNKEFSQWSPGRRRFTGSLEYEIGGGETPADFGEFGDQLEIVSVGTITEGADLFPDILDEDKFGMIGITRNRGRIPGSGLSTGVLEFRSGLLPRPA